MDERALRALIEQLRSGELGPDEAVLRLRRMPYEDLGYALVDHHRAVRQGFPEAVYGPGKTGAQCAGIVGELLAGSDGAVVLSRATVTQVDATLAVHPGGAVTGAADGWATVVWRPAPSRPEPVMIVTAGTADLAVAEECGATLAAFGFRPEMLVDVGVAGLHRLLDHLRRLQEADAVVVVAGMEGALASVVGGLVGAPVVAVPTSAGYGASLDGVTALLGMLASCASGLVVVGIDNGFGAAHAVARALGPLRGGAPETGAAVPAAGCDLGTADRSAGRLAAGSPPGSGGSGPP